jgi:hypothetical protein
MKSNRVDLLLEKEEGSNDGRFAHYKVGKSTCSSYIGLCDLSDTDYIA